MANSDQYIVGGTLIPVQVAQTPPVGVNPGPVGWYSLTTAGSAIFIGGNNKVSAANGFALATGTTLQGYLFSTDQLWAISTISSGTATVSVLLTGL